MKKYSICACVRIINPFIFTEWLHYQFMIGFEHIYLYDNKSSYSMSELCQQYIDKITIYTNDDDCIQYDTYNHFVKTHRNDTEYVAFIDDDEFINFNDEYNSIEDVMKYMEYPDYLILNWVYMGCEKRVRNLTTFLIESNNTGTQFAQQDNQIKVIVKTNKIINVPNAHAVNVSKSKMVFKDGCNDIKEINTVIYAYNILKSNPFIWIHHYYKMSRNDFLLKCQRGKADFLCKLNFEELFVYDNLEKNNSMQRWIDKIKQTCKNPIELLNYCMDKNEL